MKTIHGFHPTGYLRYSKFSPGEFVLHATAQNSASPTHPHHYTYSAASVSHSVRVKTLCGWIAPFEARYTFTVREDPYGLQVSLCTLTLYFRSSVAQLLNKINTRYGWMVNPFPTGTFTLQDTLSFPQRDNAAVSRNL
jgi:hypothetical protein